MPRLDALGQGAAEPRSGAPGGHRARRCRGHREGEHASARRDPRVVPMALYKHVADKDDLVDGMVDTLIGTCRRSPRPRPGKWRARSGRRYRAHATSSRATLGPLAFETCTLRTRRSWGAWSGSARSSCAPASPPTSPITSCICSAPASGDQPGLFTAPDGVPTAQRRVTSGTPDPPTTRHHGHRCRCERPAARGGQPATRTPSPTSPSR